jgi:hypothetical protein
VATARVWGVPFVGGNAPLATTPTPNAKERNEETMVRVWYEPPPYGPRTDLNRSGYGVHGGGLFGKHLERLSKMNQPMLMTGAVLFAAVICWIPLST